MWWAVGDDYGCIVTADISLAVCHGEECVVGADISVYVARVLFDGGVPIAEIPVKGIGWGAAKN